MNIKTTSLHTYVDNGQIGRLLHNCFFSTVCNHVPVLTIIRLSALNQFVIYMDFATNDVRTYVSHRTEVLYHFAPTVLVAPNYSYMLIVLWQVLCSSWGLSVILSSSSLQFAKYFIYVSIACDCLSSVFPLVFVLLLLLYLIVLFILTSELYVCPI